MTGIKTTDAPKPGTGSDNYDPKAELPPAYEMPQRAQNDAASHVETQFVPYRGQNTHGVNTSVLQHTPPDAILENMPRNVRPKDKRITMPEPVPVTVVSFTDRMEIIRPRAYTINIPAAPAGGYSQSTLLFGRDLNRTRVWLVTNTPPGTAVYVNDNPDSYNGFPLPNATAAGLQAPSFGPLYVQDALWVFGNAQSVTQVSVYMEFSSRLET